MEVLRQSGTYVEYAPGENYQTFRGSIARKKEVKGAPKDYNVPPYCPHGSSWVLGSFRLY